MYPENLLGAIPSEYDPRDFSVKTVKAVEFPSIFMVRDVGIYDQGGVGSCVMQSISSAPHAATGVRPGTTFGYGYWRTHTGEGMRPRVTDGPSR